MELKDRLLEVIKIKFSSQVTFAEMLNVRKQTVSSILKNGSPSYSFLKNLHGLVPDLNFHWLLFGEGDMFFTKDDLDYNLVKDQLTDYSHIDHVMYRQMRDEIDFLREQIRSMRTQQ